MEKAINRQRVLLEHLRPSSSFSHQTRETSLSVGFTSDGKVLALDLEIYNNAGNSLDLSLAIFERAVFHSDNVYEIPNVRVSGRVCFTNFPSNTAFRGFGGPQGMLITENWIQRIAMELKKSPEEIRASICLAGDSAPYSRTAAFGDDVVIVAAYRTAICKSKRGGFKDTLPDDLLAAVLKAVIDKTNVNPSEVGDIVVGTVLAPGSQRAMECRMAAFYAGFPETVPIRTVNRQCSSGLQAVADVVASIKAGFYDIGIGAGIESMTIDQLGKTLKANPRVANFAQARDCLLPMGITSENVAQRYGVTRQEQDQAAVVSHQRAAAATASGKFKDEIVPVYTKIVDPKTGEEKPVTISVDDGIRPNTNMADLANLKPAFKKDGTTTAGNASQVSDGAGAVLLMKRSLAMQKGLPILGVFRSFAAVGVDPAVMGIGPAVAIPAAVKAAGLELDNVDLFEINEAFASQFVYSCKKLELDPEIVNVNGGAMALGHPLGATGARCVATLLHEMKRRGKDCRFGVISMCIGSGMGAAAVLERGDSIDDLCNARMVRSNNLLSKDCQ